MTTNNLSLGGGFFYTLIFSERPSSSDALISLNGPTLHSTRQSALMKVWKYVAMRIVECCADAYQEWSEENDGIDLVNLNIHPPQAGKSLAEALCTISDIDIVQRSVDWYFKLMNDETVEAFYQIEIVTCENTLPGVDGGHYQWLRRAMTDDGVRYLDIKDDETNLSDLIFETHGEAIAAIKGGHWGWGPEDAKEFMLINVNKSAVENPFNTNGDSRFVPALYPAQYVSEWEEGTITTDCQIDLSTFSLINIETFECDYDHLVAEQVEIIVNGSAHQLEAEDGALTEQGIASLKTVLQA